MRGWTVAIAVIAGLAAGFCAVPVPAQEQDRARPSVRDMTTPEGLRQFQICRAAAFYHLDGANADGSRIPRSFARTLLEQINFIMFESITNKPVGDVSQGEELIRFTEGWFLGFSKVLRDNRAQLLDREQREQVLFGCQPFVWVSMRSLIDYMLQWRARDMNAPPLPDPGQMNAEMDKRYQDLTRE